jgi:hypothetical protein
MHQNSSRVGAKEGMNEIKLSSSNEKGADIAFGAVYCGVRSSAHSTLAGREERNGGGELWITIFQREK